ncbi:MAG TPA: hypothetical protein EYQ69_09145 [Gemmatimonadetes bacterium]|nr:hypothetical protein [Gemmatimonadota bacterium]
MYDETKIGNSDPKIEISRALVSFNVNDISSSLKDKVSFDSGNFKCTLNLFDVQGTSVAPSDFTLEVYPLSRSFDEGRGQDLSTFNDLDSANFITASYRYGNSYLWNTSGSRAVGLLNSTDIDIIGSGTLAGTSSQVNLYKSQYFKNGTEDLSIDITNLVSASMCGLLPTFTGSLGFCIGFKTSEETDTSTRFVKRFASRHTRNPNLRPNITIEYDDSIVDYHKMFEFNSTGSIFLRTYEHNRPANVVYDASLRTITGSNSMLVRLTTGSFAFQVTASQHQKNGYFHTGIYSASFAMSSKDSSAVYVTSTTASLADLIYASGSVTFGEQWYDLYKNTRFYSGSLTINSPQNLVNLSQRDFRVSVKNVRSSYRRGSSAKIRLFLRDKNLAQEKFRKPIKLSSITIPEMYYRIKDADSNKVLIPFRKSDSTRSTQISFDDDGPFFNLPTAALPIGRAYTIEVMIVDRGVETILDTETRFRMDV